MTEIMESRFDVLNVNSTSVGKFLLPGNMAHSDWQGRDAHLKPIRFRSYHDVHAVNAYRAGLVCLSVGVFQLENCWVHLCQILY
jgi:hypothetical protein